MESRGKRATSKASKASGSGTKKSKKGEGSSSNLVPTLNNLGIQFKSNPELKRFERLAGKDVKPTQFPNFDAMGSLGIQGNIWNLHIGLEAQDFLRSQAKTYESITLEFLSTVSKTTRDRIDIASGEQFEDIRLTFRLLNNSYKLDLEEINEILGWPSPRNLTNEFPPEFNADLFWLQITGQTPFLPRTAKASLIVHPVLRYIHRMYACTIFAREDKGTINRPELFLLWAFVTGYRGINLGKWLVDRLLDHVSPNFPGDIHIGGMITLFAEYVHIEIPEEGPNAWEPVRGSRALDIAALKVMNMISENEEGSYTMYVGGGANRRPYTHLPNNQLPIITLNQPQTWIFPSNQGPNIQQNEPMGEQQEEPQQHHFQNQMPPDFYDQFNQMFIQQNQMYQQNTQILNRLDQYSTNFDQFRTNMEDRVNHIQGRVDYIYNYGIGNWMNFRPPNQQPPPPPPPF